MKNNHNLKHINEIINIIDNDHALEKLNYSNFDLRKFIEELSLKINQVLFVLMLSSCKHNNKTKNNNNIYLTENLKTMYELLKDLTYEMKAIRDTFLKSNTVLPYLELKENN